MFSVKQAPGLREHAPDSRPLLFASETVAVTAKASAPRVRLRIVLPDWTAENVTEKAMRI
jgi:hypothetical protein